MNGHKSKMHKILITGGTGFIGKQLILKLSGKHHLVLMARKKSLPKLIRYVKEHDITNFQIITGDLEQEKLGLSPKTVNNVFKKLDYIFHLGATYDPRVSRDRTITTIIDGTKTLIELAEKSKELKMFCYVSSAHVAGNREGEIDETINNDEPLFHNTYEKAKYESEKLFKNVGFPYTIIRPTMVVGSSKNGEFDNFSKSGIYQLIKLIDRGLLVLYPGHCDGLLSVVPINWLIDRMVDICFNPKSNGMIFQLADQKPMTAKKFINKVSVLLRKRKPLFSIPTFLFRFLPNIGPKHKIMMLNERQIFLTLNSKKILGKKSVAPPLESYLQLLVEYYSFRGKNE